jgi:raffinose/stachyose/melibiose transport system substrate-binding protein
MAFLKWVGSQQFAEIYGNSLPGFFPLTNEKVTIKDPLANEFLSWRQSCKPTMRYTYQILSRGTPNLENALWAASANVINGTQTPKEAAAALQKDLASWYKPQQ